MEKVIGVVGPTASGKTAYAIKLAKELSGEVVSCDSMQIYRYMDIGTAKPDADEMDGIVHHMIDIVDPREDYSVARYVEEAREIIADIHSRGKMPILCGGTGLYFDSVTQNISFKATDTDETFRNEMLAFAEKEGAEALHRKLFEVDPVSAENIHPNNIRRVIRALEIFKTTGVPKSVLDVESVGEPVYDTEIFGMNMSREVLYDRINRRVDIMIERGLIDEVKKLMDMGIPTDTTAMQAIGYKELVIYLNGGCNLETAIDSIKQESRRYAKRQLTWFRRNKNIKWIEAF